MRIVLAGATGVIGQRLVPLLINDGHKVVGLTRSPSKVAALERAGATGVHVDILEADAVMQTVLEHRPDVVMHQVTDLPDSRAALIFKVRALGRVRTLGTDHLVAAARAVDAHVVAQSVAFSLPGPAQRAVTHLESAVLKADGQVLRYGQFYGPGTWTETPPKGGDAVHIDTAARETVRLLNAPAGIVEIRDSGTTRSSSPAR
ncbi:NAD-dependent epimerase/dehydratase family protein [Demequina sediminicola]|uniref:NAD-dependent epimerase/dehydratase family protein n=1 Tax=Demequina sediminicola TaxID=1095026 RepID=UPI000780D1E5|nr:NAD-dependent epimerase/dehydratase family protein [Demequina sediminicola]